MGGILLGGIWRGPRGDGPVPAGRDIGFGDRRERRGMKGGSPDMGRGATAELGDPRQPGGVVEPGDERGPDP